MPYFRLALAYMLPINHIFDVTRAWRWAYDPSTNKHTWAFYIGMELVGAFVMYCHLLWQPQLQDLFMDPEDRQADPMATRARAAPDRANRRNVTGLASIYSQVTL